MVTTRENPIVIMQNNMMKKSNHTDTKDIKTQKWQQDRKQRTIDLQNDQKKLNKIAIGSPCLSKLL